MRSRTVKDTTIIDQPAYSAGDAARILGLPAGLSGPGDMGIIVSKAEALDARHAAAPRVALLAPMRSELYPLVRGLSLARSRSGATAFYSGTVGRVDVVASTAGIGTRAAARAAAHMLDTVAIDHLVVVGVAGGIGAGVGIGDLIVPELVIDLATGAEYRSSPFGGAASGGTLATADELLVDPDAVARLERRGIIAIDMETAAIAAVCEQRRRPWSAFRAISDLAGDGSSDPDMMGLAGPDGSPNWAALLCYVLRQPRRIPQLARLGRGVRLATRAAAAGAIGAIGKL